MATLILTPEQRATALKEGLVVAFELEDGAVLCFDDDDRGHIIDRWGHTEPAGV
jgi:hypothetical protein